MNGKKRTPWEIFKYIGPGLLITVGFIDPGNWGSNVVAGSQFGYSLLWVVTLSTLMLVFLQHNAAHLGIVTGLCLSEAATRFFPKWLSCLLLLSALGACIATAVAEILGGAIGLRMIFGIPLKWGALLTTLTVIGLLFSNGYPRVEKIIMTLVSLVGLAFLVEIALIQTNWGAAFKGWFVPSFPPGSISLIMAILGAVVMPHNIFLHSEIIQTRQWNLESESVIERQLKYEFTDTLFSMILGWGINSAMILVSAYAFFSHSIPVTELEQAQETLKPLLGSAAAIVFAWALLFSGFGSSLTASMTGATVFAGFFGQAYDMQKKHSRAGVLITVLGALVCVLWIENPLQGLLWSQVTLSIQLPCTIFALLALTSSKRVMGKYANKGVEKIILWLIALIVISLNLLLLAQLF